MPIWVHVSGNTYGTWLPGDPRGFSTRHHREHITGESQRYEPRLAGSQDLMRTAGRAPVRLSPEARRIALDVMLEALHHRACEVRIACMDDHHFHILMRLPRNASTLKPTHGHGHVEVEEPRRSHAWVSSDKDDYLPEVRRLIGHAKSRAARALSDKALVAPGGVWATRMHMARIVDQDHGSEVVAYIRGHGVEERGAEIREPAPSNPASFPAYSFPMTTTTAASSIANPPQHPAGPNPGAFGDTFTQAEINQCIEKLASAPTRLREAVAGLSKAQLDTKYKNWNVRQIALHLADSHANAYIRWKLALTEDVPTIKPYNEGAWSDLGASRSADITGAVTFFDGVQQCWVELIRSVSLDDLRTKQFFHPEQNKRIRLADTARIYAYHTDHHIGQILWLRKNHGWG